MRNTINGCAFLAPAAAALLALACLSPPARAAEAGAKPGEEAGAEETGPEEFTDDLIILKSDLAIEGRVIGGDARTVKVLVEYGTLDIPRAAVKSIEYNLASRLGELATDDYAGRYKVLVRAVEEGNISQALRHLQELVGKPGVPQEIHKLLARCYESEGDLRKALDHWKKYALAKPRNEEAKGRIAELTEEIGGKAGSPPKGGKVSAAGKAPAGKGRKKGRLHPTAPAAGPAVEEGLEARGRWGALNWGNPASVSVQVLDGNKVVMVEVAAGGTKDKAAIQRQGTLNLSEYDELAFRVFSGEKGSVKIAVALITSKDYFESRTVSANSDWKDLSVDLSGNQWKSKATNWTFKTEVQGLDSVRQIIFLVYCGKRKALLYFDYVRGE